MVNLEIEGKGLHSIRELLCSFVPCAIVVGERGQVDDSLGSIADTSWLVLNSDALLPQCWLGAGKKSSQDQCCWEAGKQLRQTHGQTDTNFRGLYG